MNNKIFDLGFDLEQLHVFATSKINDATTTLPVEYTPCMDFLLSKMNEETIIKELMAYHMDNFVYVETEMVSGRFSYFEDDNTMVIRTDNGDLRSIAISEISTCEFFR